jgi:hypothetical protein
MMQPRRSFTWRGLGWLAVLAVMSSGAGFANGPMGGGSTGGGGGPQGGTIIMPSIPMGSGAPPPDAGSDGAGGWGPGSYGNYPPAGRVDRNQQLIDQIRQNGENGRQRDEEKARRCEDLRRKISQIAYVGGGTSDALDKIAIFYQRQFDSYSRMSPAEIDAEIRRQEREISSGAADRRMGAYVLDLPFLKEMRRLRARYGTGRVYQNALKDTELYREIKLANSDAALSRRDVDEPALRDARAEYAELSCDRAVQR